MSVYDEFAADYHWLYDDVELRLGTMTPGVRAVLAQLPVGARLLDAACGVGVDASALLDRGFDVVAADGSAAMVAETRHRLAGRAGSAGVIQSRWIDLPSRLPPASFDAILCLGNSVAHVASAAEMVTTFEAFHLLLSPGGVVVLDTHHWEELTQEGDRTVVDEIDRHGVSGERSYHWSWGHDPWTCTIRFHLRVWEPTAHALDRDVSVLLHPFTASDLRHRLRQAGFGDIGLDVAGGEDRYTAVGRAPGLRD